MPNQALIEAGSRFAMDSASLMRAETQRIPSALRRMGPQHAADELDEAFSLEGRALHPTLRLLLTTGPIVLADLFALLLSGLAAVAVLHLLKLPDSHLLGPAMPLVLLPLVLVYLAADLYNSAGSHAVIELRQLVKINTIVYLAFIAASALSGRRPGWPVFFAVAWAGSVALVPVLRSIVRRWCSRQPWWGSPTLIISSGASAQRTIQGLLDHPTSGLRPSCVFNPAAGHHRGAVLDVPVVNTPERAIEFATASRIRYGIIAMPDASDLELTRVVAQFGAHLPRLLIISEATPLGLWSDPRHCGGAVGMEVQNRLIQFLPQSTKAAMDLTLTILGGTVILPLFAVLALAVKLSSRGPVFYAHTRIGRGGRKFRAWKFRTMVVNGDQVLQARLAADPAARAEWEQDHKLRDDPRVTGLGRWMRKTSLDELPQLWNVLKGDMSLVGPRPIIDAEVEKYGGVYKNYKGVKPGITGLWQVSGRNNTTYAERVRLDQYYVRNWSPWVDAYILAKTITTLITRDGAY
jgi:Undecaprenyl-phosphate galactose phosphotransferase WbaP